jgi:hypothetical protein
MKPAHLVEERRKVLANYAREQRNRTRHINTPHSLFVRQGITTVVRSNLRFAGIFRAGLFF